MFCTRVRRNERISSLEDIRKPKYLLELELNAEEEGGLQLAKEILRNYDAGDSYCILFENPPDEIDYLLNRFGFAKIAKCKHELIWTGKGELPAGLNHLPKYFTPRQMFTQFLDFRRPPGKSLIRALAEFTTDPSERRRLLELVSTQGASEFTKFIRQASLSLLELVRAFPSIKPPLEFLIELLPRLLPRHYTLTNFISNEQYDNQRNIPFRFTYSLLPQLGNGSENDKAEYELKPRQYYGVCSQWLLNRNVGDDVWLIQKEPSKFRLPPPISSPNISATNLMDLLQIPLLMVGPGTGIAPFIAFLEKIRHLGKKDVSAISSKQTKRILIYASSNLEKEFLFSAELRQLQADGVLTDLILCESRPSDVNKGRRPERIYDALRDRAEEVACFLMGDDEGSRTNCSGGLFFACGDVKNMSRELWTCLSEILQKQRGLSPSEAIARLSMMRKEGRLIEDVWS